MLIRIDDTVVVLSGDDKGKTAKVLKVDRANGKVIVEGINRVYKHVRKSQKNPQGGRLSKEMPIDMSKVALVDPSTGKPTRVGVRLLADGSKERFSKKSGTSMGKIAPPRAKKTK
jgi:large subunit ribosomal protein L24